MIFACFEDAERDELLVTGPYLWVQLTGAALRACVSVEDNGDALIAYYDGDNWIHDGRSFSDVVVYERGDVSPRSEPVVRVLLRAPRKGERGWMVCDVSSPEAALAEALREGAEDCGEYGWEAEKNYDFQPDEYGMWPVTIEVVS